MENLNLEIPYYFALTGRIQTWLDNVRKGYDDVLPVSCTTFTVEDSMEKTKDLLKMKNRPTALFSISNRVTIGALKAINKMKLKIPDDISIIGFDELKTSELLNPPLTVVVQPAYEFGEEGIDILIKKINGRKFKNKIINLKPELIIRKSCRRV